MNSSFKNSESSQVDAGKGSLTQYLQQNEFLQQEYPVIDVNLKGVHDSSIYDTKVIMNTNIAQFKA